MSASRTAFTTCPLCEATCGLEVTIAGDEVERVRADDQDVFSQGFICPKGASLKALHDDPDRLRNPLAKREGGYFEQVSWDEAFALVDRGLAPVLEKGGRDAIAVYLGNPNAHSLPLMLYGRVLLRAIGSKNVFTASTLDQMPKHVSAGHMFGSPTTVPVPDLDRSMHVLMLGANPYASNGSLMTAPNARGRLQALRKRGGRLVVVDPRRSRTAEEADEHVFVRPGGDAFLLMGMVSTLFEEDLVAPGPLVAGLINGLEELRAVALSLPPEAVDTASGVPAADIRRLARELATAESAAVYGRIGTCTQEYGTLASWLVDVLNVLTGNLDRPGGAMFPRGAAGHRSAIGEPGVGPGFRVGRWASRVSGHAEALGELPVVCLAEEIETPGEGQVRGMITMAGNPVLSAPNGERLDAALSQLDFVVSVDIYLNETTRHADVILPPPSPLQRPHFPIPLYQFAVRNVANYSPAPLPKDDWQPHEWEILLRLAGIAGGAGPGADIEALDDLVAAEVARQQVKPSGSKAHGRDPQELLDTVGERRGPERLVDLMLRAGPYGDGFGAEGDGGEALNLEKLEANPHGVDLGALEPRLPGALRTPSGKIELAPEPLIADVERLRAGLARNGGMVLIGRRQLRSNNSWMHNIEALVRGPVRCTMHVHPADAERLGLVDGETARVASRAGAVEVPVEVTDAIMPGVVSIPHGWGHDRPGIELRVASSPAYAGVNANLLVDESVTDPLSGNAVFNGVPVTVAPA